MLFSAFPFVAVIFVNVGPVAREESGCGVSHKGWLILLGTFFTLAANRLDVGVVIFFSVIYRNLLSCFDPFLGPDPDSFAGDVGTRVGRTGVVDITG